MAARAPALWILAVLLAGCSSSSGNECAECMREKCSDLIALCQADSGCACMVECTGDNGIGGIPACLDTCGLADRPPGFAEVEECSAIACPDSGDECATPADWTPPSDAIVCDESGTGGLGGGAEADCSFDTGLAFDPDGAVLQLQTAAGDLCARVERRDDGAGTLANTQWTLLELRIGPPGAVAVIDTAPDLCWYSSHHNFRDWAHGWSGSRHFDLVFKEDGRTGVRTYELYVFEQGSLDGATCEATIDGTACIDGPIELLPVNP